MEHYPCRLYIIIKKDSQLLNYEKGYCIKIGITNNVENRFIQLDTHPEELELLAEYEVKSRAYALEIEGIIGNLLQHKEIRKEWFYLTTRELILIDNVIVEFLATEVHYYAKEYLNRKVELTEVTLSNPPYFKDSNG